MTTSPVEASTRSSWKRFGYPAIAFLGLAYAFYRGYLFPLHERISTFNNWQTGDWLINYSGGIVRRGFTGEVLFAFLDSQAQFLAAVAVIQVVLAGSLFTIVGLLYWRTSRGPVWLMVILSPAFLLFPALDLEGNARKELLVLVALALVALGISTGRVKLLSLVAFPLFAVGVLSHEALVLFLPSFLILFWFSRNQTQRVAHIRWMTALYSAISLVALVLAVLRPGDSETVAEICASWQGVGLGDCGGALPALTETAQSMQQTLLAEYFPSYWSYLLPLALAALPFFAQRFLPRHWVIALIIGVALLPLFVVAWDYGRWIFFWAAQMSLLTLALTSNSRLNPPIEPMRVPLIGALAFILLWGFNHAGTVMNDGLLIRWLASITS